MRTIQSQTIWKKRTDSRIYYWVWLSVSSCTLAKPSSRFPGVFFPLTSRWLLDVCWKTCLSGGYWKRDQRPVLEANRKVDLEIRAAVDTAVLRCLFRGLFDRCIQGLCICWIIHVTSNRVDRCIPWSLFCTFKRAASTTEIIVSVA